MMRAILASGAALCLAVAPATANGPESAAPPDLATRSCVDAAVDALQRRYEEVRDLSARFEQTARSVALGARPAGSERSSGRVQFAKPGRMRWSYEEPDPSLVVSDGSTLWIYDPELREVQKLHLSGGYFSGAAIQFLLGEGDMRRDFDVRSESCQERTVELELVPKQPAPYEKLHVRTDRETGDVLATRVFDLIGNVTQVTFSGIEINLDPDPGLFSFAAPPGVEVIELGAPAAR